MPKDIQSIEDLINSSDNEAAGDETALGQFAKKQQEIKIIEMERATKRLADDMGMPYVDLFGFSISHEALSLMEEGEARRLSTVCFYYDGKKIRLGTADYKNKEAGELLQKLKGKYYSAGQLYLISKHSLDYALNVYKAVPRPRKTSRGIDITEEDLNKYSEKFSSFTDIQSQVDKGPNVTDIVTIIMSAAVKMGATDIHIEGEESDIKVRFRIDGVLHDAASINKELWNKVILRLKMLTNVKVNITNKPQDGRTSIFLKDDRIDIRASFLPTNFGESVVMRLLRSSSAGLEFEDLGFRGQAYEQLKREIERPNGMIIATGPTGSGKTTTLYAVLEKLNTPETKIITIEDPIEYQLSGINQSQVSEKYTFAQGLRSIIRQDPDILMVGEIRDLETADISIQAALTGHLVLSTIHTNRASGTIPRLLSMGVKPFLLAPALNAMIGQRLVRRICRECQHEDKLDNETAKHVKEILEKLPSGEIKKVDLTKLKFSKSAGCEACQGIGYKGRIGIFEILIMNKDIEKLILSANLSEYDIEGIAVKNGMVTMLQDGLLKALDGLTSIEEVFRVAAEKE